MKIGTRSVLYGAHCWPLHTLMLVIAWTKLYGFPWDLRLWFAFALHDIGYIGKPNMDGPEGETHPILGARIMGWLFGPVWETFTISHSRFYAKREGFEVSQLCVADKLATVLTPNWLYLRLVQATGEITEYRTPPDTRYEYTYTEKTKMCGSDEEWVDALKSYMGSQVPKLNAIALGVAALTEQMALKATALTEPRAEQS